MKLILFCLVLLGRLGTATHLLIQGTNDVDEVYFHQSEYRLMGTLKDMAADCDDAKKQKRFVTEIDTTKMRVDQRVVEEVDVCVLDWNAHMLEHEHRYEAETPVAKMFYFLKHIAPNYNDCSSLKYELSSAEDIANEAIQAVHQVYNVEANEECGKIGLKKPLPEGGFSAMTVRIMKTREETLKDIKKNVAYFENKFSKLEATEKKKWTDRALALKNKAEEEEAKKAEKSLEEWREEKKSVPNTKTAFQLYKEDQEAVLTKLLDKETITISEIHDIQLGKEVGMDSKSFRIFKNENNTVKGDNEMETNPFYGRNEKVKDVILEFFRFQIRDIGKGKAHVEKKRRERVGELIENAKDILREKERKKRIECEKAKEKWEKDNENKIFDDTNPPKNCVYTEKTDEQLEKEAPEETLANVSGWYGHVNLPVNDCQLNELKIDGQEIPFETSINSPRSLVRMLNVANHYNFQMLLDFSGAKLASVIHDNDLYRLRAMLGFDFLGDYTWESYIDANGNRVSGIKEIEVKNPWFDKDSKNEKYHHSKPGERPSLQGIGDFDGRCKNVIISANGVEHATWKLGKADYEVNDLKLTNFQAWATEEGKDIPAEKMPKSAPYGYTENSGKVYSNSENAGIGTKDPLASVDQQEQQALLQNLEDNTEEAKQKKRDEEEKKKQESADALKKMQDEADKQKEKLDQERTEAAKDFKLLQQQHDIHGVEEDEWDKDGDEEMDDPKNDNDMGDNKTHKE